MTSFIYKKFVFDFYPTDLVNNKNNYPPQGRFIELDIYLDASPLDIYFYHNSPPLRSPMLIFRAWVICGYNFSSTNNIRLTVVCVLGNQCVMGSYMKRFVRKNRTTHQTSSLHFCVVSGKFCKNQ